MPRKRTPKVRICEWCGHLIGAERGPASKTCSPECQRDRNNDKEKKRYLRVKHTPEWQEARADYIARLKERLQTDAAFAARYVAGRRTAVRKYRAELEKDPVRWAKYQEKHRAWFHNLTPEQRDNARAQNRAWYANLDPEFKRLFLLQLREKRAQKRLHELEGLHGQK